jgi:hypothetical protein
MKNLLPPFDSTRNSREIHGNGRGRAVKNLIFIAQYLMETSRTKRLCFDRCNQSGGTLETAECPQHVGNVPPQKDALGLAYNGGPFWGAAFSGGAPFVMYDGSVRLIGYEITGTFSALMTHNAGDISTEP